MKHNYIVELDLEIDYTGEKLDSDCNYWQMKYECEFCKKTLQSYKLFVIHTKKIHFKQLFEKSVEINDLINLGTITNEYDILNSVKNEILKFL